MQTQKAIALATFIDQALKIYNKVFRQNVMVED